MVTTDDIKYETNNDSLDNDRILRAIKRAQDFIRGYTNNPILFVEDNPELDEIIIYLVSASFNEDVKGRAGLKSESVGGVRFDYLENLPKHYIRTLNRFTRARTI